MATETLSIIVKQVGAQRTVRAIHELGDAAYRSSRAIRGLQIAVGLLSGGALVRSYARLSDTFTRISNQIKVAGIESDKFGQTLESLRSISQRTRTGLEENAELFGRITQAAKELNANTQDTLRFVELTGKGFAVQGTATVGVAGATIQLSQALGEGIVRAQEFNSLIENNRPILLAAARGIDEAGGSLSKLRNIMLSGELSSERFFRGVLAGSDQLEGQFAQSVSTVGQAFLYLNNELTLFVGRMEEMFGFTQIFISAVRGLADNIDLLAIGLTAAAGAGAAFASARVISAVAKYAQQWREFSVAVRSGNATFLTMNGIQVGAASIIARNTSATRNQTAALVRQLEARREAYAATVQQLSADRKAAEFFVRNGRAFNADTKKFVNEAKARRQLAEIDKRLSLNQSLLQKTSARLSSATQQLTMQTVTATNAQNAYAGAAARPLTLLQRIATVAPVTAVALGGLTNGFKNLLSAMGGIWGIAATAVITGLSYMALRTSAVDKAMNGLQETMSKFDSEAAKIDGVFSSMDSGRVKSLAVEISSQLEPIQGEIDKTIEYFRDLGEGFAQEREALAAGLIDESSITNVNEQILSLLSSFDGTTNGLSDMGEAFADLSFKLSETDPAAARVAEKFTEMINAINPNIKSAEELNLRLRVLTATSQQELTAALQALQSHMDKTADATDRFAKVTMGVTEAFRELSKFSERGSELETQRKEVDEAREAYEDYKKVLEREFALGKLSLDGFVEEKDNALVLFNEIVDGIMGIPQAAEDAASGLDEFISEMSSFRFTDLSKDIMSAERAFEEMIEELELSPAQIAVAKRALEDYTSYAKEEFSKLRAGDFSNTLGSLNLTELSPESQAIEEAIQRVDELKSRYTLTTIELERLDNALMAYIANQRELADNKIWNDLEASLRGGAEAQREVTQAAEEYIRAGRLERMTEEQRATAELDRAFEELASRIRVTVGEGDLLNQVMATYNGLKVDQQARRDAQAFSQLADAARDARDFVRDLVEEFPEAIGLQKNFIRLQDIRSGLEASIRDVSNDDSLDAFQKASRISEIQFIAQAAISELDGTAEAARDAAKDLREYENSLSLSKLDGRNRALENARREYEAIVKAQRAVDPNFDASAAGLSSAYADELARINTEWDERDRKAGARAANKKPDATFEALMQELRLENELLKLTEDKRAVQQKVIDLQQRLERPLTGPEIQQVESWAKLNVELERQNALFDDINSAEQSYSENIRTLSELLENGRITNQQYTDSLRDLRLEFLNTQTDFASGWERAVLDMEKSAEDFASVAERAVKGAADAMADALIEMAEKGKVSFGDLVSTILKEIIRLQIAAAAAGLFRLIGTSLFGGATSGGFTPQTIPTSMPSYGGAPLGFATGGSFIVPGRGGTDSTPVGFMATPGERVTVQTPAQQRSGDGSGIVINYAPSYDARGADSDAVMRLERAMEKDRQEFSSRVVRVMRDANKNIGYKRVT